MDKIAKGLGAERRGKVVSQRVGKQLDPIEASVASRLVAFLFHSPLIGIAP
jgi:hypothetical protein